METLHGVIIGAFATITMLALLVAVIYQIITTRRDRKDCEAAREFIEGMDF